MKDATVLIVDDEPMLLDVFREWLQEEGCGVLTAGDGAATIQILRNDCVDVIVSDVRMPVMDGIVSLKNLSTLSGLLKNNHPKMIFIGGFTDLEPRAEYNLGVEPILQKPIDRARFVGAIRGAPRSHEETWSQIAAPNGMPLHVSFQVSQPQSNTAVSRLAVASRR